MTISMPIHYIYIFNSCCKSMSIRLLQLNVIDSSWIWIRIMCVAIVRGDGLGFTGSGGRWEVCQNCCVMVLVIIRVSILACMTPIILSYAYAFILSQGYP